MHKRKKASVAISFDLRLDTIGALLTIHGRFESDCKKESGRIARCDTMHSARIKGHLLVVRSNKSKGRKQGHAVPAFSLFETFYYYACNELDASSKASVSVVCVIRKAKNRRKKWVIVMKRK